MTAPQQILVCGNKEPASNRLARWDKTPWNGTGWIGEPAAVQLTVHAPDWCKLATIWAVREWMKICALEVEWESNPRAASVNIEQGPIDGPSGTLAYMHLPYGPDKQLDGKVDTSESWHKDPDSNPGRGMIHLGAVLCHEFGHALGIEHVPTSQGVALLNPMHRPDVLRPQTLDAEQAVYRYGPKLATPTPDSGDPEPGLVTIELSRSLAAGRYHLIKQ